jgi:hypothetical protein
MRGSQPCSLVEDKTTTLKSHSTRLFSWFSNPIQASLLHSQHIMTDLPPFTYTPLSANEIRLLTPVIEDDSIAWTLSTVQLDFQDLKFETLSYVWGSQDESFPIVCNEKLFWVHHNLYTALPYLARRANVDEVLPMWIDAICINQTDDEEKIVQIRSMNQIYRRASRMWIWLGIAEYQDYIPEALSTLLWLHDPNKDSRNLAQVRGASSETFYFDPSVRKAMIHLIVNPWYRRLWVTQELALSRCAVALCGEHGMTLNTLEDAQRCFLLTDRDLGLSIDEVCDVLKSNRIFSAVSYGRGLSKATSTEEIATLLIQVAILSLYQQCLQPRDRVLGLLGLLDTRNIEIPIGDFYSCASIPELYTEFGAFLLSNVLYDHDTRDEIWVWLDKASVPGKDGCFPSWVPDLHHLAYTIDRWSVIFHAGNEQRDYKASRRSKAIRRGCQKDELKISGRLLDSVVGVSSPRPIGYEEFPSVGHVVQEWNDLADWEDNAANLALSGTESSLHDFCHTLVGGQSYLGRSFDPCQMRRRFRISIDEWKRLYADFRIEERYGSLFFIVMIRNIITKLTPRLYQVD